MLQYKKSNINRRKVILGSILSLFALVAIVAGLFFFTPLRNAFFGKTFEPVEIDPASTIDYSGPSENDVNESQNAKKKADEATDNQQSTSSGKKNVPVAISYADIFNGNLEVRAFVSGVIEGAGSCTVTVSRTGSTPITESAPAFIDASTTQCEPVFIARSRLSTGRWNVVVTFTSPDTQGSSEVVEVTIE